MLNFEPRTVIQSYRILVVFSLYYHTTQTTINSSIIRWIIPTALKSQRSQFEVTHERGSFILTKMAASAKLPMALVQDDNGLTASKRGEVFVIT